MNWPSKSVAQGGVFHSAKAQYSAETKNFLKLLMDESHLNNNIRQKINYTLRSGDSLPKMYTDRSNYRHCVKELPILIRSGSSRRRSQNEIIQSGAYEREKFIPDRSKEDREILKQKLQNIMAYGKKAENKTVPKKVESTKITCEINKFDELMQEIKDRQAWLIEMEKLGEAHKYREVINLQIEAKLREMEKLKSSGKCSKFK